MGSIRIGVVAALVTGVLLAGSADARDIYVAVTGSDSNGGTSAAPYRNIKTAISRGTSGDVIHVRAGTYSESWIDVKSGQTLISEDGLYAAKINSGSSSGLRFESGVSNCVADGFECYASYGQGSAGDGLVRIYSCSNITVRNLLVHDAPSDCDCIKVGGSGSTTTNVLIESCVVYNPAPRVAGGYQECIDIYPADHATIRHCWLYHTPEKGGDALTFCKGGCTNITWENNVFGPAYSGPSDNVSCMAGGPSPAVFPACTNFIARNNLFLQCSGDGAFGLIGVKGCQFYNNIIWGYKGGRCAVEFYTALIGGGNNQDCYFNNNIIWQTNGTPAFADRGKYTSDGTYIPTNFQHDYNVYYQASGGDVNINAEAHSLRGIDPKLYSPSGPVLGSDTWTSIVARFQPLAYSPVINVGTDLGTLVPTDIYGIVRPIGTAYDIGPYEIIVGDLNNDGHVDVVDLLTFVPVFGLVQGDPGYDPICDFNGDNSVDVIDLLTFVGNFGVY